MSTPQIPALLDPAQYALTLTPGTYTDLVAGTLGNTADPSDGFDLAVLSAAMLPEAMFAELPNTDTDLIEAGTVTPVFSTTPGAALQAQLQPVSDAIDADLATFIGAVLPTGPPAAPAPSAPSTTLAPPPGMGGGPTIPGTGLKTPIGPPGGTFPPAPPLPAA
jgi:hypothetical protein